MTTKINGMIHYMTDHMHYSASGMPQNTGICRIFATLRANFVPYMEGSSYNVLYSYSPYKEGFTLYSVLQGFCNPL